MAQTQKLRASLKEIKHYDRLIVSNAKQSENHTKSQTT